MNKINLLNDFFIRYLLASKGDEDILENIVNAVLTNIGFETVHNLEIINPYNLKDNQYLKESILDVKAKTNDNKKIIIEFQLFGNIDFLKRIYYYISKNIALELKTNEAYRDISQIISINFLDFNLNFNDNGKEHRCFKLIDTDNHDISLDMIQIHLIEIKRFKKILEASTIEEIKKNKLLSWIEFFTSNDLNKIIDKLKEENIIMSKVIEKYKIFTSDEESMQVYNAREAFLYGQEVMLKREREEGKKEGIKEGIEKGVEKEKYALAKNMKTENIDINLISKITGLSKEEIDNL
ncbi:Rpn family recombination-promoting nuclease/putative transposase [Brachyspira pilosicoli]|uniref:ATPase n=1 Tax=Brachyspira pilosicoli B2904 TaxID=1133568 RepID=J9TTM6_BRAPL|nr:Rpn family recombination-promoting nuclease/putative transposase [Brachyspira pilosicoli]AFR70122.1 hypothetical protein B2904_orf777 [Brachyspira pilosicoli B2904]